MMESHSDNRFEVPKNKVCLKTINFAFSFQPAYYFCRVFGLMPFSFVYNSAGEIQKPRICIFDGLWFVIVICWYLLNAFNIYRILNSLQDPNVPYIITLGYYVFIILGLIYACGNIVMDTLNRFKWFDIWKNFSNFDREVNIQL